MEKILIFAFIILTLTLWIWAIIDVTKSRFIICRMKIFGFSSNSSNSWFNYLFSIKK